MAAISWKIDWKWGYFVGLLVFLLLIRTSRRFVTKIYNIFYALLYSYVSVRHSRQLNDKKEELFKDLHEISKQMARALCVLEIGSGPGSNFHYLPNGTNIMCLDPNPYFETYLKRKCASYPDINLQEFLVGRAEDLSILPNGCVDAVISTSVLCSVNDVELSVAEVKRVLRPVSILLGNYNKVIFHNPLSEHSISPLLLHSLLSSFTVVSKIPF